MNELAPAAAFVSAVGDAPLWDILIKSTIAIALAGLACRLLGRQSAALRHRVWVLGLAASLVVPAVPLFLPQFALPVLATPQAPPGPAATQTDAPASWVGTPEPIGPDASRESAAERGAARGANGPVTDSSAAVAPGGAHDEADARLARPHGLGLRHVLAMGWLLGTLSLSTLCVTSLVRQSLRLRRLRTIEDEDWVKSVTTAATALGLRRHVIALQSDEACVPAVVGLLSPRLVIPPHWLTWSPLQRHCILLHELAHVKRRDLVTQWLGRLAVLAYWFNPLVWYAVRRLRTERELASDDCVLLAGPASSDYAEQLLNTLRGCRAGRPAAGVAMAHSARLDQRVLAILDPARRRDPVRARFAALLTCVAGAMGAVLGGVTLTSPASAHASPEAQAAPADNVDPVWKENYAIEYSGTLPVSVAFSADGETLLTGDTAGEVMALIFADGEPRWRWKSNVEGSHAAVAFSADGTQVYATTTDGVRILDAARGQEQGRIEEKESRPTAIGVFPDKSIAENFTRQQIVFGTPRGYFVESWAAGKLADTVSTLQTSTVAEGAEPEDEAAVPLAVDPEGRSAIMTGPVDSTGELGGRKGRNVLWAYVCGDYDEGSPGNRVMPGHDAVVVSAAWANEAETAVTGDAKGRVIVWDTSTMKETRRFEFGGRVAALALSDDGARAAAYVLGAQGEVYVWTLAEPPAAMTPIHTELSDFSGTRVYASLDFAPDGKRLAACASNKRWLKRSGRLIGRVRIWELSPDPNAQRPPKQAFVKPLPKDGSLDFVMLNNYSLLVPAEKPGAVDLRRVADGDIQARIVLGEFLIKGIKVSRDRNWLAVEQHPLADDADGGVPDATFDVGVYEMPLQLKLTIPACTQLLDVAPSEGMVAVVREKQIELWDVSASERRVVAPFPQTRIDAAGFSPDGRLLAVSDRNSLVLWRLNDNTHERIDLDRTVGSLAFSPNGRFLAEGPTANATIQIRDLETREIVQTLTNGAEQSMNVPRLVYSQSGRVLIACDNTMHNETAVPHRIYLWDTADGSLAHRLAMPAGLPHTFDVSPNGRYLVATLENGDGATLCGWRLDGEDPAGVPATSPPATVQPR